MWNRMLRLWGRKRRDQEDAVVPTSSSYGAATTSAASGPSPSPYFSSRIQSLSERRSDLRCEVEFEMEASKCHWTESSALTSDFDEEEQRVRDRVAFEKLKEHPEWGPFFRRQPYELDIGQKIAEGGQAEIFEALGTNERDYVRNGQGEKRMLVVKVFKRGFSLEDVQRLCPSGLAEAALPYRYFGPSQRDYTNSMTGLVFHDLCGLCWPLGAQLLEDGRFAFIFDRFWGDLRKLIDKQMLESNGAPPFPLWETYDILRRIAKGMDSLHKCDFLHKDLKASNVLVTRNRSTGSKSDSAIYIADFESSVEIAGTCFWRAPEILLALKNCSLTPKTFSQKSDVYGYGMTCYEVLTGRLPFEGHPIYDYDIILRGERRPLPDDIYPPFKGLVAKCWHEDPLQRPSFDEIVADLLTIDDDILCKYLSRGLIKLKKKVFSL